MEAGDKTSYMDLDIEMHRNAFYSWYFAEDSAFFVGKLAGLIGFLCFNSYVGISLIFATLSFLGLWHMYLIFVRYCPDEPTKLAWVILLLPSSVFWGSGLFKDTITLGSLCYLIFALHKIFVDRDLRIRYFIYTLLTGFLIYKVKSYLLVCFVPTFSLWVMFTSLYKIKNKQLFNLVTPILILSTILLAVFIINSFGSTFDTTINSTLSDIQGAQEWHTKISASDRRYTLGEYESTFTGVLSKLPLALSYTLFRPFPWESSGLMLLASLESMLILIYTIYIFFGNKLSTIWKIIIGNPIIIFCFSFTITLGFIVGLSSYNFGALTRYRIPLLPLYLSGLILLFSKLKSAKAEIKLTLPQGMIKKQEGYVNTYQDDDVRAL